MPPKSGKKSGPKGPPNEIYYEDHSVSDDIVAVTLRMEALKKAYVDRMEEAVKKQQQNLALTETLAETERMFMEKTEERQDVLADYTRQYKTDEREKIAALASLDSKLNRLQEERLKLEKAVDECEASFDKKIKEKRSQVVAIAQRTAEMEKEFAAMLSDVQQSVEATQQQSNNRFIPTM